MRISTVAACVGIAGMLAACEYPDTVAAYDTYDDFSYERQESTDRIRHLNEMTRNPQLTKDDLWDEGLRDTGDDVIRYSSSGGNDCNTALCLCVLQCTEDICTGGPECDDIFYFFSTQGACAQLCGA